MNLLESIVSSPGALSQLGKQFGLDDSQTEMAVKALLPALSSGLKNNVASTGGLDGLLGALSAGGHQKYLDDPSQLVRPDAVSTGNGILGHLLGSKAVSRATAQRASEQTGIGSDILKQMLPVVATMVMGSLSKQTSSARARPAAGGAAGMLGMLTPMLDADGDGSVADDLLGMASRFFK